jgi:hypothetical protein
VYGKRRRTCSRSRGQEEGSAEQQVEAAVAPCRRSCDLLAAVATHPGIPVDRLDPEQYDVAVRYGCVYEYRGRVGLTGAGA